MLPWDFQTAKGRTSIHVTPTLAFNDAESVIQAGVQGLGIIQTGYAVAATYVKRGELVPLFESLEATGPGMWVVYPQRRHLPSRVHVFIDWVSELSSSSATRAHLHGRWKPKPLDATARIQRSRTPSNSMVSPQFGSCNAPFEMWRISTPSKVPRYFGDASARDRKNASHVHAR